MKNSKSYFARLCMVVVVQVCECMSVCVCVWLCLCVLGWGVLQGPMGQVSLSSQGLDMKLVRNYSCSQDSDISSDIITPEATGSTSEEIAFFKFLKILRG